MCYNGYNENQYQYPNQYPNYYGCPIYPVPFMPVNPMYAHAYVPYQSYTSTFPLAEALQKGTLFPDLTNLYDPYEDYSKIKGCWDHTGCWKEEK